MKKHILIAALSLIATFATAQTQPKDTVKVVVPEITDEMWARIAAAEEEQRIADSITIARVTKKFIKSIPEKDLMLITSPNMKVIYIKKEKSTPKKKSTH